MKKNLFAATLIAGTAMLWSCGNDADNNDASMDTTATSSTTTTTTSVTLDTMDANFAMKAASGGMMEVQAANLAMQNASSEKIKSFATMMIRDHGKANEELKAIAASKNITLPTELMPEHQKHIDMMKDLKGKAFDTHYADMMQNDHKKDVEEFEKASNDAKDADIKGFAAKTLPTLRMHLDSAQALPKGKM